MEDEYLSDKGRGVSFIPKAANRIIASLETNAPSKCLACDMEFPSHSLTCSQDKR
jgi:hypothetical protein